MKTIWFDTETTGLLPGKICQLSYIIYDDINDKLNGKNFYFTVPFVEPMAEKTHGLSVDDLQKVSGGKTFEDSIDELYSDFSTADLLVAHNIDFDMKFLKMEFECSSKRIVFEPQKTFCTMKYYTPKLELPHEFYREKYAKLQEVTEFLEIDFKTIETECEKIFNTCTMGFHDAMIDVTATYLISKDLKLDLVAGGMKI